MPINRIVVLMGSKRDLDFASRIGAFLVTEGFPIECEYSVASAHKTPEKLLDDLHAYELSQDKVVFITVAGLSDALSGVVAGYTKYPVIACPPDMERYGLTKVFSSTKTPRGIAVSFVPEPENAALMAIKILALTDRELQKSIIQYIQKMKENVYESDKELKRKVKKVK